MTDAQVLGAQLGAVTPSGFCRLVERLLWHLGFSDVSNVDGAGDGGADIVATRESRRWAFQVKWKQVGDVDSAAVDELLAGMRLYDADQGAVVTNRGFTKGARDRVAQLRSAELNLGLWEGRQLLDLANAPECVSRISPPDLRPYQVDAFQAAQSDLKHNGSALLVLATGLGKTVIAGSLVDWYLSENPDAQVLVLAHTRDLVDQLERSFWRHLPKHVPTQQLQGDEKPDNLPGVTVGTVQSAVDYVRHGFKPDFIFVDEAHHTGDGTLFAEVLERCPNALRLGATATPWRGDEFDVATFFGEASYLIGIEEGMRLGYLVDVKYRLYVDNIDWDYVRTLSRNSYSIGELNRQLFLPQRDERIRDELLDVWMATRGPRGIVFCQTIEHAEAMLKVLRGVPEWNAAACIHNRMPKREQRTNLAKFRLGDIPLLVAVDILNEGVDVPDVNVVCFARVTHSRRIFVQQLGRGLRLRKGKSHVSVLDFVTDLRRAKAMLDLRQQVEAGAEHVMLPSSHSITFNDTNAESLLREWLFDAADLETEADEVRLNFPPSGLS